MKTILSCAVLSIGLAGLASAQPRVNAAFNAASYARPGLPGDGIAQGSIFVVFTQNAGPAALTSNNGFPLATTLANTGIEVVMNGVPISTFMIYASAGQSAAILPSSTPVGNGKLRVLFNGQTSNEIDVKVVRNTVGIFTLNSAGTGAAIVTNAAGGVLTLNNPARPGQRADIYATGLTGVNFPDNQAAQGVDFKDALNMEVFVGGKVATILYAGRSGCCAGLDQIVITIPNDVSGCFVSLMIRVNGANSNFTTIPVAASGSCSDPNGYSSSDIDRLSGGGQIRTGSVILSRTSTKLTVPTIGTIESLSDAAGAAFVNLATTSFTGSTTTTPSAGSCVVFTASGNETPAAPNFTPLRAGTITVSGAAGTKTLTQTSPGTYGVVLANATTGLPTLPGGIPFPGLGNDPPFLQPGTFSVNATAGADVGAFSGQVNFPGAFAWANMDAVTTVTRTNSQDITWTGAGANDFVNIIGSSRAGNLSATFYCIERASANHFAIPSAVLSALPPSDTISGSATGFISVTTMGPPVNLTAANMDYLLLLYTSGQSKTGISFR